MEDKTKKPWRMILRDFLITVITALIIAIVVLTFIRPTLVKETSMLPTVNPNDYVIMSKQSYTFGNVKKGDIIIFESELEKEDGKGKKLLIKRVIGLPGDIITVSNNKVYINGFEIKEKYTYSENTSGEIYNLEVPEGEVFVMGDHREVSLDSRKLGCIKQDRIKGKAVFRLFPLKDIGVL